MERQTDGVRSGGERGLCSRDASSRSYEKSSQMWIPAHEAVADRTNQLIARLRSR
jgi:hypothetical protein